MAMSSRAETDVKTPKTWIILDDDPDLLAVMEALVSLWDREPILLKNGAHALAWITDIREGRYHGKIPELALLDIRMPDTPQGDEIARMLRDVPQLREMAIVLMTAFELNPDAKTYLMQRTGADGFVRKPFPGLDDFLRLLEDAIDRRRALSASSPLGPSELPRPSGQSPDRAPG